MKKNQHLVFNYLKSKPRIKALGFNKEELEGIAADIADNLEIKEDASEEEVQETIEKSVDAAIPFLVLGQKTANRVIQKFKDETKQKEVKNEDEESVSETSSDDKIPAWAKGLIEQMSSFDKKVSDIKDDFNKLHEARTVETRKDKLAKLLQGTGAYGNQVLKSFQKMTFDSEDEFNEYLTDVENDLTTFNKERAELGLSKLGVVPAPKGTPKKPEVLTDQELNELASQF